MADDAQHWLAKLFSLPKWAKELYDWSKFARLFIGIVSVLVAYFVGREGGYLAGVFAFVFFAIALVLLRLVRQLGGTTETVISVIESRKILSKEEKPQIVAHLRKQRSTSRLAFAVATAASVVLVIVVGWSPVCRWLTLKQPEQISFMNARYFDPAAEKETLDQNPYLQGVIDHLKEEARPGGKEPQIILADTNAFEHATPPFRVTVTFGKGLFDVAGYAFLRRRGAKEDHFGGVPIDYSKDEDLTLNVPACERGDCLFIIARVIPKGAIEFPDQPTAHLQAKLKKAT